MARGESAKEIAKQFCISTTTTRNHTRKILARLDLYTELEAEAGAYCYKHF